MDKKSNSVLVKDKNIWEAAVSYLGNINTHVHWDMLFCPGSQSRKMASDSSFSIVCGYVLGIYSSGRVGRGQENSWKGHSPDTTILLPKVGNRALGHSNKYADTQSTLVNVLQLLGKKRECKKSGPTFLKFSCDFRLSLDWYWPRILTRFINVLLFEREDMQLSRVTHFFHISVLCKTFPLQQQAKAVVCALSLCAQSRPASPPILLQV